MFRRLMGITEMLDHAMLLRLGSLLRQSASRRRVATAAVRIPTYLKEKTVLPDWGRSAKQPRDATTVMPDDFKWDVFPSHSTKDKAVVCPLAERLRKVGLKVWFGKSERWLDMTGNRALLFRHPSNAGGDFSAIAASEQDMYSARFRT